MKFTRRDMLAAGLSMAVVPSAGAAQEPLAEGSSPMIGGVATRVGSSGVAGMVLAGTVRVGSSRAVGPTDRWHIGSNTKAMTAALYARLVDAGLCRWGATPAMLFPDIDVNPAWGAVTVEQIMGHLAGVDDSLIDGPWLRTRHADIRPVTVQRTEFVRAILTRPPAGKVGAYAYGNANYLLLGAAIERATGSSWEAAMERQFFVPLGMTASGFGAPPGDGPWGHQAGPSGPIPIDPRGIADNPAVLGPAGRVNVTMGDYARFLALFLSRGRPLISSGSMTHLLAPSGPGAAYAGGWALSAAGDATAGSPILTHEGSNTFWYAITVIDRNRGIADAAVVNEAGERGRKAALSMLRLVRGAPAKPGTS